MSLPIETLLLVFVAVTAVALILQSIVVWKTMRSASDLVHRVSGVSQDLEKDAREVMAQLQKVAGGLDHVQSVLENLGSRAGEVNTMLAARTTDLDELVNRLLEVGNRQADKIDEVVSDTVAKFEQTTEIIQQDILRPVLEISSVLKGLRTGFEYLFSRKAPRNPAGINREEDLFI